MIAQIREIRLFRFAYAASIIARILTGYRLLALRRGRMSPEQYSERLGALHQKGAEHVYNGVIDLKGLMIKIGQTIGSRADIFPEEYVRLLSRLQDKVPPRPFRIMRPHIERQLGGRIEDIFDEFDHKPVAAASLAQLQGTPQGRPRCSGQGRISGQRPAGQNRSLDPSGADLAGEPVQ